MTETVADLESRLTKVRAAIDAAMTGKSYKIESGQSSRELERQSLKDLLALEQMLLSKIARIGGGTIRHAVPV